MIFNILTNNFPTNLSLDSFKSSAPLSRTSVSTVVSFRPPRARETLVPLFLFLVVFVSRQLSRCLSFLSCACLRWNSIRLVVVSPLSRRDPLQFFFSSRYIHFYAYHVEHFNVYYSASKSLAFLLHDSRAISCRCVPRRVQREMTGPDVTLIIFIIDYWLMINWL